MAGYGASVLTVGNGGNGGAFSGAIQNSGPNGSVAVVKTGSGTQYLSGVGTYTGGTTLSGGVLNFSASALGTGSVTFSGGTLQYASGNTQDVSPAVASIGSGQAAKIDTNGNSVFFGSGLSGNGGLTKLGSGMLTLNAANSYLGTTTVSGGTLQLGTGIPGALPGGAVTANGGFLDLNGNSVTVSSLSSSPTAAGGTITNSAAAQVTLTLNQTTSSTFGGSLTDGAGGLYLTMNGSGMLTLTGVNTYSYTTAINAGVLKAGAPSVFAPHSDVVVTGGTLDASNSPQSINSLTMGGAGALNLTIGSLLTTNNLHSINNLFGGTLNLYLSGGTSGGEQLISYGNNAFSGSFTTVDLNGIPDPSLASSLQYTANALELPGGSSFSGTAAWATGAGNWSVGPWSPNTAPTKAGNTAILNNASSPLVSVVLDVPVSVGTLVLGNTDSSPTSGFSISFNRRQRPDAGQQRQHVAHYRAGGHARDLVADHAGRQSERGAHGRFDAHLERRRWPEHKLGLEPGRRRDADPERFERLHERHGGERRHADRREPQRHSQRVELDRGSGGGIALWIAAGRGRGGRRRGSRIGRRQFRRCAFGGAGARRAGAAPGRPWLCGPLSPRGPKAECGGKALAGLFRFCSRPAKGVGWRRAKRRPTIFRHLVVGLRCARPHPTVLRYTARGRK